MQVGDGGIGKVTIGFAGNAALASVLPAAIRDFRMAHPDVELVLKEMRADLQVESLLHTDRYRIRVAYLVGTGPRSSCVVGGRLALDGSVACRSSGGDEEAARSDLAGRRAFRAIRGGRPSGSAGRYAKAGGHR